MKISTENKEIIAGTILVCLLACALFFLHSRAAMETDREGFVLYAPFSKTDGLMTGADVRVSGIRIGRVLEQTLANGYQVRVKIGFDMPLKLSDDSSAVIETDGLLGAKYLEITPGGSEDLLESGDEIAYTQDAMILTELMDKINAYMREKKKETPDDAVTPTEETNTKGISE